MLDGQQVTDTGPDIGADALACLGTLFGRQLTQGREFRAGFGINGIHFFHLRCAQGQLGDNTVAKFGCRVAAAHHWRCSRDIGCANSAGCSAGRRRRRRHGSGFAGARAARGIRTRGSRSRGGASLHLLVLEPLRRRQHGIDPVPHLAADFLARRSPRLLRQFTQRSKLGPQFGGNEVKLSLLVGSQLQLDQQSLAQGGKTAAAGGLCLRLTEPAPVPGLPHARTGGATARRRCRRSRLHTGNAHAQRCVRNLQHIVTRLDHDAHIGSHAWQQAASHIREPHDRHVSHDVGHVLRRFAHLAHFTLKSLSGKGIYGERSLLAGADATDIGLIDAGIDLHVL